MNAPLQLNYLLPSVFVSVCLALTMPAGNFDLYLLIAILLLIVFLLAHGKLFHYIQQGNPSETGLPDEKPINGFPQLAISDETCLEPLSGIEFVRIPAGGFYMGSRHGEKKRRPDEGPVHKVGLDAFLIGKYPVTQAQWIRIMGTNPSRFRKGDAYPVERVSWHDAREFLSRLNDAYGHKLVFRLPTEAEWEYAARAGSTAPYCFGQTIGTDAANFNGKYVYNDGKTGLFRGCTSPAGSFPPNAFGVFDMHGNVWEWCEDWFDEHFYLKSPPQNPLNEEPGEYRLLRGGSWFDKPEVLRSAYRDRCRPDFQADILGFRVVLKM